jgi:hypothetical protein
MSSSTAAISQRSGRAVRIDWISRKEKGADGTLSSRSASSTGVTRDMRSVTGLGALIGSVKPGSDIGSVGTVGTVGTLGTLATAPGKLDTMLGSLPGATSGNSARRGRLGGAQRGLRANTRVRSSS